MIGMAKALVGATVAGLGAIATALVDERVTAAEWVGAAIATLLAAGAVWRVPNGPGRPDEGGGDG